MPSHSSSSGQARLLAVGALVLSMLSLQVGAAFAKQLFPIIGPIATTGLRSGFAALVLCLLWRPWRGARLRRRQWLTVLLYGLSLGLMNLCFYNSLHFLPLGVAVAVEFTGPFCLALASSRRPLDFVWLGLAVAGLLGLDLPWRGAPPLSGPGLALALAAGACWAAYILFGQRVGRFLPGGRASALGQFFAATLTLPLGVASGGAAILSLPVLMVAFVVAMMSGAIPYSLEMISLKRMPAKTFSILVSLEPAVGAAVGWLGLHEHLSPLRLLAMAALIIASLGCTATSRR